MEIKEERFRPILITKGRKTGKEHSVMLRAVKYNDKIYNVNLHYTEIKHVIWQPGAEED